MATTMRQKNGTQNTPSAKIQSFFVRLCSELRHAINVNANTPKWLRSINRFKIINKQCGNAMIRAFWMFLVITEPYGRKIIAWAVDPSIH